MIKQSANTVRPFSSTTLIQNSLIASSIPEENAIETIEENYQSYNIVDRQQLMTPERYFQNKNEPNTKKETSEEKAKKQKSEKKVMKHIKIPMATHVQRDNLSFASGSLCHLFYDNVNLAYVTFLLHLNVNLKLI